MINKVQSSTAIDRLDNYMVKMEKPVPASRVDSLISALNEAVASDYVAAHPELRQELQQSAQELAAHPDQYQQVRHSLRKSLLEMIMVGGVKSLDPSLDAVGKIVLKISNGNYKTAAWESAAMLPIWTGGKL